MLPDTVSTSRIFQNTQQFDVCSVEERTVPKFYTFVSFQNGVNNFIVMRMQ